MEVESKKIAPPKAVARAYWRHTMRYKGYFFASVGSLLVIQISAVISPLFLRQLINVLSASQSVTAFHAAFIALVGYAIVQMVIWVGWRVEMFAGVQACSNIMNDLTKEAFGYLMHHSYQFFTSAFAGALTRRVGRYSDSYNRLWDSFSSTIIPGFIYTCGIIAVLWYQHAILGITLAISVVIFISIQWLMSRWQQPLRAKRAEEDSNLVGALADSISNHNTVQVFSGNRFEEKRVGAVADQLRNALLTTWTFDIWIYAVQSFLSLSINIGLLWIALVLWQRGVLTIGDFILIQSYFIGLINNVWSLGREFRNINTAFADAGEMVHIMSEPHGIVDDSKKSLVVERGVIRFADVNFGFQEESGVLSNFNLTIESNQKVALVGPSGAGKTTITKLLLRFFDVTGGSVEIDGQDISKVTQDSLRNAIAFVPQEPVLFHRTLMENIRYGRRDASDAEVIEAAKKAHCDEFISALPLGYNTFVGERGIKLSGGERQRVAIARAILKNAPILVLDEATSSLDSQSEAYIQEALEVLMRGKTVIVIAHRLSTIMKMDRIIVLEGGKIIADGTHQKLLEEGGLYAKLWSIQAGGFLASDEESDNKERVFDDEQSEEEEFAS